MATKAAVAALMILLLLGPAIGQGEEVEKARQAVKAAGDQVEMAGSDLRTWFSWMRCDFQFLRSGKWTRLSRPYVDAVEEARGHATESAPDLAKRLAAAFEGPALLSKPTTALLAGAAAREILSAASGDGSSLDSRTLLDRAVRAVFTAETFEVCWTALLDRLEVVGRWREAHQSLSDAEARLARLAEDPVDPDQPDAPPGMVLVPKGRFKVGPWEGWTSDLKKNAAKTVQVKAFFVDVHEVTNEEFREFLSGLGKKSVVQDYLPHGFVLKEDGSLEIPEGSERHPVRGITFPAARAFARSKGKRLPTEDEWERAARGKKGLLHPWGDEFVEDAANWKGTGLGGPTDVGTRPKDRSPDGVMDMGGNVSELTANLDGRRPVRGSLKATDSVVHRGGSYADGKSATRAIYRWVFRALVGKKESVGFRCVLSERDWKK